MKRFVSVVFLMSFFSVTGISAQEADTVLGVYTVASGKADVEIYKCGTSYCGKIVWLASPLNSKGIPKVDGENPDVNKKTRPIMGMDMVWGFKYKGNNYYEGGNIYDPEEGKTYSAMMTLKGNKLDMRGYIGISLIGKTTVWTKKQK
jgi:uncharacterized protein (DUF2147 family)